jgi:hypothetical protein
MAGVSGVIEAAGRPDAGAFLARLLRLDPAAVVRLRPADAGPKPRGSARVAEPPRLGSTVAMWARVPFGVLVTRRLRAVVEHDVTVRAGELLRAVERDGVLPPSDDHAWRWPLPPGPGEVVEELPAAEVRRVAAAAAAAAREALTSGVAGQAVGSRRVRDALLDHIPIVVDSGPVRVEVAQRLVQALVRMGFIGEQPVAVRRAGPWTGLSGEYGTSWHRPNGETLALQVAPYRPNG